MAERWAVATGNANNTATWDGGTLPATTDDVYANGFTVTVNVNTEWKSANTIAGTTAVAGGGFTLSNGVTLTLDGGAGTATAGSTTCVTYAGTSGNSATIIGNLRGSITTGSRYGAQNSSTGTLNVIGNCTGGNFSSGFGLYNLAGGTVNVTGNAIGGSGSGAVGVRVHNNTGVGNITGNIIANQSSGAFFAGGGTIVGNVTGSSTTATIPGISYTSTAINLTVTGTVTGGSLATSTGITHSGTSTLTINGNVIGGTNATAYGVNVSGGGSCTVNGVVSSPDIAPGLIASSSSTLVQIEAAETGGFATTPISGKVLFKDRTTASFGVRVPSVGLVTLTEAGTDTIDPLDSGVIG